MLGCACAPGLSLAVADLGAEVRSLLAWSHRGFGFLDIVFVLVFGLADLGAEVRSLLACPLEPSRVWPSATVAHTPHRVSVAVLLELTELAKPVEMPGLCCDTRHTCRKRDTRPQQWHTHHTCIAAHVQEEGEAAATVAYTHEGTLKVEAGGVEAVLNIEVTSSLLYPHIAPVFRVASAAVAGAAAPLPLAVTAAIEAQVNLEAPALDAAQPFLPQLAWLCSSVITAAEAQ